MQLLSLNDCLISIIVETNKQACLEKDPIKINSRTFELLEMIRLKVSSLKGKRGLPKKLSSHLQALESRLSGWLFSVRQGWI